MAGLHVFSCFRRWHPIPASLLLAVIWAGWHLPLWWFARVPASFGFYVVGIIPLTYLFTWVFEHSRGSVLLALLFHASLNTSMVRLPIFAAWIEWTVILWLVALTIVTIEYWQLRGGGPKRVCQTVD